MLLGLFSSHRQKYSITYETVTRLVHLVGILLTMVFLAGRVKVTGLPWSVGWILQMA